MQLVPMLQVDDVAVTSRWYQDVLGLVSGHGGDEFEMLFAGEPHASALLIQLHRWDTSEHGSFGSPDLPVGNGMSLWLQVDGGDEFDSAWQRVAATAGDRVTAEPAWNPQAHHHEFALADPHGYVVVVHTPFSADPS